MNLTTVILLLKVAYLMREMPAGQGWITGTQLRDLSGVSHATTYRYLSGMVGQGLLEPRAFKRGKLVCSQFRITEKGRDLLQSQGDMFAVS